VPPFRSIETRATAELVECDVTPVRADVAALFGARDGERFAADRSSKPGGLLRLAASKPRV
jgi:hypothetical protein